MINLHKSDFGIMTRRNIVFIYYLYKNIKAGTCGVNFLCLRLNSVCARNNRTNILSCSGETFDIYTYNKSSKALSQFKHTLKV